MIKGLNVVRNNVDKSILVTADTKPLYSLIWLHGLGDTSEGFLDFFSLQQSPIHLGCRVKLLQAPLRPVTINGGAKFPSWYDIKSLMFTGSQEKHFSISEIKESLKIIDEHVEEQVKFWKQQNLGQNAYQRIFVGGFSQGCAVSLLYGLSSDKLLGGAVGWSGHLFQSFDLKNQGKLPLLINHGQYDSMIPFQMAVQSYDKIIKDEKITFKSYNIDHQVTIKQVQQLSKWFETAASLKKQ